MNNLYLLPNALVPPAETPIQGTFLFDAKTGTGVLQVNTLEGTATIELGGDIWNPIGRVIQQHLGGTAA